MLNSLLLYISHTHTNQGTHGQGPMGSQYDGDRSPRELVVLEGSLTQSVGTNHPNVQDD